VLIVLFFWFDIEKPRLDEDGVFLLPYSLINYHVSIILSGIIRKTSSLVFSSSF
jgi:hypothetical protein